MFKNVLAAATAAAVACLSLPAFAAPFVNVRAHWDSYEHEFFTLPDGIGISCRGDAVPTLNGCGFSASLNQTVTASGTYAVTTTGSVVLTNTTDQIINGGAVFNVWLSSFNPGGPGVGLGIDDPLREWASFQSNVSGPGVGDSHMCSVGFLGESGTLFSPTTCGVSAPDSSLASSGVSFTDFMPGAEMLLTYAISISATFVLPDDEPSGVPEPGPGLAALGLAALTVRAMHRRRRDFTST